MAESAGSRGKAEGLGILFVGDMPDLHNRSSCTRFCDLRRACHRADSHSIGNTRDMRRAFRNRQKTGKPIRRQNQLRTGFRAEKHYARHLDDIRVPEPIRRNRSGQLHRLAEHNKQLPAIP